MMRSGNARGGVGWTWISASTRCLTAAIPMGSPCCSCKQRCPWAEGLAAYKAAEQLESRAGGKTKFVMAGERFWRCFVFKKRVCVCKVLALFQQECVLVCVRVRRACSVLVL